MSVDATLGAESRAGKRERELRDAIAANAGEAFPGLPNHLVIAHIFRSEYFDDSADLARLPAVSRAMRDAVAAKWYRFTEMYEDDAVEFGCSSVLKRKPRRGHLSRQEYLLLGSGKERTTRRVEAVA
tara:strand:+ start:553 stop:933 length:381 start_codon:yes stop_codon:yes gene_type:complete